MYYTAKLQNNSPQHLLELWQFCRVWELNVCPCLAPVYNRFFYKLSSHSWKYNIKFSALFFSDDYGQLDVRCKKGQ